MGSKCLAASGAMQRMSLSRSEKPASAGLKNRAAHGVVELIMAKHLRLCSGSPASGISICALMIRKPRLSWSLRASDFGTAAGPTRARGHKTRPRRSQGGSEIPAFRRPHFYSRERIQASRQKAKRSSPPK